MKLRVGTSGFAYDFWKGGFYPEKIEPDEMLAHYASRFETVELNNTFYRIPKADVVRRWADAVPETFRFVIKASRRITHQAKLVECDDTVSYLYRQLEPLGTKLGAVLFQLPPFLRKSTDRLQTFVAQLPGDALAVVEFRHDSWFCEEVYEVLRARGATMCIGDYEGKASPAIEGGRTPMVVTSDVGYLRLRDETYEDDALRTWAREIASAWSEAYVFFKHEETAPTNVERMRAVAEH